MRKLLLLLLFPLSVLAAPLPDGTKLSIAKGVGSGSNVSCTEGSCFGMEVAPKFVIWTDIEPGTDGGFVIGRDQTSGGQELGPSSGITTPGSLTKAWLFFGNFGTFFTSPGAVNNVFDDASCVGAACIGKTELKVFNVAWNGSIIPMGGLTPCTLPACTPDQIAGIFTSDYSISADAWSITHSQVVPSGGFTGVKFQAIIKGSVTLPAATTRAEAGPDIKDQRIGNMVKLEGVCSDTGSPITDCSWSEPVGQNLLTSTANPTSFTPIKDGVFTFTLTATSAAGKAEDSLTVFVEAAKIPIQTSTSGCSLGQGSDYSWLLTLGFLLVLRKKILA